MGVGTAISALTAYETVARPAVTNRTTTRTAAIAAIGTCLPATVVPNGPIAERIGVTDEWIVKRTGIHSRHVIAPDERLADLAAGAGRDALEHAGVEAAEIDMVLVATTTSDELLPNTAPIVAHALGARNAAAFDVGAACTGFLSGLAIGAAQIEAGRATNVLLVGADAMSRLTDPDCRHTAALFADGAGAALLAPSDDGAGIGPVTLGADGGGADLIVVEREEALIRMAGHETFKHAVARMSQATHEALELAELGLEDIDLFVYHQANARILRAVAEQLGLSDDRVIDCIGSYANTSAATLPLALAHARDEGRLQAGDRVLLAAFGAGFTWGAAVVHWNTPPRKEDPMSTTTTTEQVERVVIETIERFGPDADEVTRDSTFEALDVDSLDLVELGQVVEDELGVKLEAADVGELKTVGDAIDLVAARAS